MNKNNSVPPEEFFENWGGNSNDGMKPPKFAVAEGSSLNLGQLRRLTESKIPIIRPKGENYVKVFVPGPGSSFYSTIIPCEMLKSLAYDLLPYGVKFSVRDQKTYGIE